MNADFVIKGLQCSVDDYLDGRILGLVYHKKVVVGKWFFKKWASLRDIKKFLREEIGKMKL